MCKTGRPAGMRIPLGRLLPTEIPVPAGPVQRADLSSPGGDTICSAYAIMVDIRVNVQKELLTK